MEEDSMMTCPFCMETDFDVIGLKHHLLSGGCEIFNTTRTVEEERHLRKQSSKQEKSDTERCVITNR